MKRRTLLSLALVVSVVCVFAGASPAGSTLREKALKNYRDGNYKTAYEFYRGLALNEDTTPKQVGGDLNMAIKCLRSLNRVNEIDDFLERVIEVHGDNWRLLRAAAENYVGLPHWGYMIAGEFHRGRHRGGGERFNALERDRVRALQLMTDAMEKANGEKNTHELAQFYFKFANMLTSYRGQSQAWRLQYLSDFSKLPDYERGYGYYYYGRGTSGAPVHTDGTPVYHQRPASWETAKTDGERWRWLLLQASELDPGLTNSVQMTFANFLRGQFGVQTMAYCGRYFGAANDDKDESGTYALHTLGENETIAKLATGIKRFTLPDEFNYIKIYQDIADGEKTRYGETSLNNLAQIFENRRQYPKAADYWKRSIKEYGPGHKNHKKKRLQQIIGNLGMFEPVMTQPAGKGATIEFRFRNGEQVSFEAHAIKVRKLLDDVKAYIKSCPNRLDWRKSRISNIGWRLVHDNQEQYIGEKVAGWELDLEPRKSHFDKRATVATPLQKAGAYLLTAKMKDGNTSKIIIWLDDTVIVKKPLSGKQYVFVADATTGKPVPKANVEFFGYRQRHLRLVERVFANQQYAIDISNFAEFTDKDGQIILDPDQAPSNHRWMIVATTPDGRFAYLGFTGVWYSTYYDHEYNQTKTFVITDRPVYRPKHTVKFKFWVRHAKYDQSDTSDFANQRFWVQINDAKRQKVFGEWYTTDAWGGLNGEFPRDEDAALGQYRISLWRRPDHDRMGNSHFRVEEYKKPEFEVNIEAPTAPVMLGEKITATVTAKYYFGAPVTKAKVKYKVLRSDYSAQWYPTAYWDWFYGPGYWWFGYDYSWYPGWYEWGCERPHFVWWSWGWRREPPEVVMENEVKIGHDGTVKIEIDTAIAKELHGDSDHKYEITAEVVDQSRRTIVGKGSVMVAREPFKVYAWVDRGHYRIGDVVRAHFNAQPLDNRPVKGEGEFKLLRITYKDNKPVETVVQEWDLDTNDRGRAAIQMKAHKARQYRLSYNVTDAKGQTIEGGYVFIVAGEGFDGSDFRFNDIELVTDKREYKPGEKVKLRVNTNRIGSTVLLFMRPSNGVYLPPKVIRMNDKSVMQEIAVTKKDMPNFFVEAVTISGGKLYTEAREVIVPPEKRVLRMEVVPSAKKYKPGEKATVEVKLTDFSGEPFVGSIALTMYDEAVEYISGGSNVPEIRAFFWKWRRRHQPRTESSLGRRFNNLVSGMSFLGVFGRTVVEEGAQSEEALSNQQTRAGSSLSSKGNAMPQAVFGGGGKMGMDASVLREAAPRGEVSKKGGAGESRPAEKVAEPTVRKKFADTAFWKADIKTDKEGKASFELTMPENLTGWKVKAWGMGHDTKVGQAQAEVTTFKNLLLRMQAPRFFVEKDEVVLSANIHNYLKSKKTVTAVLELDGDNLKPMGNLKQKISIDPNGEKRVDWRVKVVNEGEAVIRMKALTDEESDAMEMRFPVYVHGMLKTDSFSGAMRPEDKTATITIDVPEERRINQSRLELRYSPTLAGAMVDALPYTVEYPYGCTEQTLNRFLPTVITQKILLDMGLDLEAIGKKRTNLNAQEIGDDVKRAHDWKRLIGTRRWDGEKWVPRNPVFDEAEVARMVKEGVKKLTPMQLSDGGWGWFSGWGEHSYPHTTALVVHGLQLARENDVAIVPGVLERGIEWLKKYQAEQIRRLKNWPKETDPRKRFASNSDAFVYMVLVDADVADQDMLEFLYRDRTHLAVYAKAMFGMALHKQKLQKKLAMVVRNIDQYLVEDDENQTAYLKLPANNWWWCWYGSEYEAQAYYLKLLSRVEPKTRKASRLVKYLLNNRKHAPYWNSTRDTAICIEAFADYLKATGEHKPDMPVQILVDGKKQKEVKITADNLFTFDNKLVMLGDAVESGKHKIELRKKGRGPLYFNAYLTNFTLEDFITKAGLEIKVDRHYYKLVKVEKTIKVAGAHGQPLDQKVEKYERKEIDNLATLKSGDLVEIELVIESKNDYEYIVFEDMKAAGFEPVKVRSGYTASGLGAYMELRDEKVCFFVRQLARGKHSVSYRLRAEIPGKFSALPTRAYAMYAPELKANSDEMKLKIED